MAESDTKAAPEPAPEEKEVKPAWREALDRANRVVKKNRRYQVVLMVLFAVSVALMSVFWLWSQSPDYQPLYGNQELYDVASVVNVLDQNNIAYKIHPASGQVMVDVGRLSDARMQLAVSGVQARMPEGLETLDGQEIGTSQFVENVRYRRGLEGELAQTIISLKPVRNARIHLALPKQSSFIRKQGKPSASVFVDLFPGYRLSNEQIEGIVNLVAASVANMNRSDVSVIDQSGKLLSSDVLLGNSVLSEASKQLDFKRQVEAHFQQRISALLEPLVGAANFRAQVSANVDFEQVVQTVEQYDPGAPVLRSEQGREVATSGLGARGIPGALSNQPPNEEGQAEEEQSSNIQSEFVRNYEVDKVIRQVANHQGRVQKLSVAVVLNEQPDEALGIGDWDQARIATIQQMIIDATGIDQARGDQISIHTAPFVPVTHVEPVGLAWWQQPQVLYFVKYGCGTLLGILVIMFLLRPMMKQITLKMNEPEVIPQITQETETQFDEKGRKVIFDDTFDLLPPELADFETQVTQMRELSTKAPARVAQVIKLWMNSYE
ncbi:flagellar basal-body MS-ring/collar protein FliF [Endozoicomonas sp. 8E]|uniref:flagellar basal-body MS-ring/collar protein FliF n=1 Tax=Endozoicomonas sp. 8E TaxID=3035692 RepID=UPI0029393DC6|nr:flagellar basal-body MS-ring/collar protein FliF [Endozoicomonas sp. 8E]WOG29082.1 flagellar basal-body MS-ring/collar protein FliF [Endozoicomonas sp. 8E]